MEFLRTVLHLVATFGTALPRGLRVQSSIDAHRPQGRFWYLHYVGVRPEQQGKGHGGRIIRAQTAVADTEGLPAGSKPRRRRMCRSMNGWDSSRRRIGTLRARSEEHTSELQSLMRISYAVF